MYHVKMDLICIICAVLLPMNMLSQAPRKKKKYPRLFGQILKLTDKRWDRFLDTKILWAIQPGCGENRVSLNTSLSVEWSLFVLFVQMHWSSVKQSSQSLVSGTGFVFDRLGLGVSFKCCLRFTYEKQLWFYFLYNAGGWLKSIAMGFIQNCFNVEQIQQLSLLSVNCWIFFLLLLSKCHLDKRRYHLFWDFWWE